MASAKLKEAKIREGEQFMAEGDKLIKRTLTRWKPDFEGASLAFDKGATALKNAQAWDLARDAFVKAADAQYQSDAVYHAGRSQEAAGQMCTNLKNDRDAGQHFYRASMMYREAGSNQKAAETVTKAARTIQALDADQALEWYYEAIDIYESMEKEIFSHETFQQIIALLVKLEKWEQVMTTYEKQLKIYVDAGNNPRIAQVLLSMLIIYLKMGDYVAAEAHYQRALQQEGFMHSKESEASNALLDAYEKGDEETFNTAMKLQTFNFLDQCVIRVVRSLDVAECGGVQPAAAIRPSAALFAQPDVEPEPSPEPIPEPNPEPAGEEEDDIC